MNPAISKTLIQLGFLLARCSRMSDGHHFHTEKPP
ncbi:hypothetical protein CBM2589_A90666 [Cupriavidus taiwanensis]|uniref:Uncharacterized protein n=1 Tax=Cupriavidus taiwanensis TaxID=164546 RepID=A0A375CG28_9BURK|nr:hypothetical protein CBM2589_A90666 [Cupriavidus taiwanensis]